MSNRVSNYWDRRTVQRLIFSEKQSEVYIKRIKAMYSKAEKNIQGMIDNVYKNYAKDTGLDVQTLKELLSKSESKKMWNEMKRQGLDQYVRTNYKSRITRLERLQMQVYAKAKELYNKERLTSTELYKKILKNNYYRGIYDIQTGVGLDFSFAKLDDNTIKALLQDNWSGKNYSERIWGNTDILAESLSEELGGAILSGQGIEKTAGRIRDRFGVAKYYATRLVRTETNHFHTEADFMAYEEMGIDKYVFVATLDNRTSTICQELDGKVFEVKDKAEGKNAPPMHPNCRSVTRAYVDDIAERRMKRWAKDPITGDTKKIGNKTYKEWYQDNVAKYGQDVVDKAYSRKKFIVPKEGTKFYKKVETDAKNIFETERWNRIVLSEKIISMANDNVYLSVNAKRVKPKKIHNLDVALTKTYKLLGESNIKNFKKPQIVIASNNEVGKSIPGLYNILKNTIYLNEELFTAGENLEKLQEGYVSPKKIISTILHESIHWFDAQQYIKKNGLITTSEELKKYNDYILKKCNIALEKEKIDMYNISRYATYCIDNKRFDEVYTEYRVYKLLRKRK